MVLESTSCFDELMWAEIVISESKFVTKFDQIFYHYLTDWIVLFLLFCFIDLFQDHNLVEDLVTIIILSDE